MNLTFPAYCAFVVVAALALTLFIAPLMWDAAGYIVLKLNEMPMIHPSPKWGG